MRVLIALALSLSASSAHAFCGFFVSGADQKLYNNASHVVLMRKGNRTVMTMSNTYKGPPSDFAMVVPVPVVLQKKQVKTLHADVFRHIDELTAPRLVEYWEQDPCGGGGYGIGSGRRGVAKSAPERSMSDGAAPKDYGVKIEAKFVAGEYEVLILSAQESGGLEAWLKVSGYQIPDGAAEALAPYVRDQMKFFVAKVDTKKVKFDKNQQVMLSPLQFSFESNELRLPVRLGLLNAESQQDLIVYVLSPNKRFEVANYPNLNIVTNLDVVPAVKKNFGAFYAELFDETLRRNQNKGVVTEYAWDTGSCDPCPGPPLEDSEIDTLGASRLGNDGQWVVTRLHTRYDKQTLTEDLVFRAAKPLVGGRAERDDGGGPRTARKSSDNNFQARYIIRHYWGKKVTCDSPQRGMWGGPPDGREENFRPRPAKDLASAARGEIKLGEVVKPAVPELGLPGLVKKKP
jgi:hypothetical protein